jgi:tetratricopeptide (TPR) repeat protein
MAAAMQNNGNLASIPGDGGKRWLLSLARLCGVALVWVFAESLVVLAQVSDESLADADQRFRQGQFSEAASAYRKVLTDNPKQVSAYVGLARTLLKQDNAVEAERVCAKGFDVAPDSPSLRAVLGDVYFRQARFDEAKTAFVRALRGDSNLARAYLGLGRVLATESNYKSAKQNFIKAHELDPKDPEVLRWWASTLKRPERVQALTEYLGLATNEDPDVVESIKSSLELLKAIGDKKTWILQGPPRAGSVKLTVSRPVPQIINGLLLGVSFNGGKSVKLLLDTGASGILIHPNVAKRFGLRPLATTQVRGVGDEGKRAAHFAWADSIKIGDLEFRECIVDVSERKIVADRDGLVGPDLFARFRIALSYRRQTMDLSPLPPLPREAQEDEQSRFDHDRIIPPEMRDFTPIRKVGTHLLIETRVNDKVDCYFLIDTGSTENLISNLVAKEVTDLRKGGRGVTGLSGRVKDVYEAYRLVLQFAHFRQENIGLPAFDLRPLSKRMGTEVSGILGHSILQYFTLTLNYRDGLVDFAYEK